MAERAGRPRRRARRARRSRRTVAARAVMRLAPTASRMPISRRRASARASITLATLAQATTRRMATAPRSVLACGAKVAGETPRAASARTARPCDPCRARPKSAACARSRSFSAVRDGDARLQPADAVGAVALIRAAPGSPGKRHPQPARCRETDRPRGHHADDRVSHAVQLERAAEHVRRPPEAARATRPR